MNKSVLIATPAYDGTVHAQYAVSLNETIMQLAIAGIEARPFIECGGSLLIATRNRILQTFLDSEATHLLCIDSDLGWPAEAVLSMLQQNKDFIAGVYPARNKPGVYLARPQLTNTGEFILDNHLIKADYVPAGFMLLTRECVLKMCAKFPHKYVNPKLKHESSIAMHCLFETEVFEEEFWGEDFVFCRRAREAGLDIWVDPLIEFDHAGTKGALIETLVKKDNTVEEHKEPV